MAQIGQFTRDKSGFTGRIHTLTVDRDLILVPAESSDAENAPDYRIHLGDADGPEIGAGWKRTGEKAGDYVSLVIDDPVTHAADPRQPLPVGRRQVRLGPELEPAAEAQRAGLNSCASSSRSRAGWRALAPSLCSRKDRLIPPPRSGTPWPSRADAVKGGLWPALAPCP